jgi:hypothetical protein
MRLILEVIATTEMTIIKRSNKARERTEILILEVEVVIIHFLAFVLKVFQEILIVRHMREGQLILLPGLQVYHLSNIVNGQRVPSM